MTTRPDPLATLPPVLASKLRNLPPHLYAELFPTKEKP